MSHQCSVMYSVLLRYEARQRILVCIVYLKEEIESCQEKLLTYRPRVHHATSVLSIE